MSDETGAGMMGKSEQIEASGGTALRPVAEGDDGSLPVLIMMMGRGRVGKTATATILIQFYRSLGSNVRVWNADQQNTTHSLSRFHEDALEPAEGSSFEDRKRWLEERIQDQRVGRYDAVIDFPGGDSTVLKLAQETRLIRLLERMRIRPVVVHVVGPEQADLDYLRQMAASGVFMPEATIIVLNGGLVQSGRSIDASFSEIRGDTAVREAVSRGAVLMTMPALPCMSDLMDMGIWFSEAARAFDRGEEILEGGKKLSLFNSSRTATFWEDELPEVLSGLPPSWTPGVKGA